MRVDRLEQVGHTTTSWPGAPGGPASIRAASGGTASHRAGSRSTASPVAWRRSDQHINRLFNWRWTDEGGPSVG